MLREFLYVDTDKVRSLLAQLDEGVEEEVRVTEKTQTKLSIGTKQILNRDRDTGTESSIMRSLADAVFPALESAMESSGYLVDISEKLKSGEYWSGSLQKEHPEGSFIRVTAPARLFDSKYVLKVFSGLAAAASGYTALTMGGATTSSKPSKASPKAKQAPPSPPSPEDEIEDFPTQLFGDGLTPSQLRGFAKLTRAMFYPGLVLVMNPSGDEALPITARLQEGRRFLESDAEILFARYGLHEQYWTMVGTIGSFSPPEEEPYSGDEWSGSRTDAIDRAVLTKRVNALVTGIAQTGFADIPQYPGFSVVPFAVYRTIMPASKLPVANGAVV